MPRTFLPAADSSLSDFVARINAALGAAPMLNQAIQGVQIGALDQTRNMGREYQLLLTHDAGTEVLLSPFQVQGFEGTNPNDVAAQMTAWVAAHPALWVAPAYTVGLPAVRYDRHQAGFLFWCADAVHAGDMWEVVGGAGGGGNHNLLVNRNIINQHPALAVVYDAITLCPDAATTTIDSLVIQAVNGAASHYEVYASDVADPDAGFFLGRFTMATGPAGGAPAVNLVIDVAGANAIPGLTLGASVALGALNFTATVAGLAAGVKLSWRRITMTAPV
jgi:hypothetical protein